MATIESESPIAGRDWNGIVAYPDPAVQVHDPRFAKLRIGNAAVERLYTGARWAEGPVWFGDHDCLLFSDIPNNRILRYDVAGGGVSEFRRPSNNTNGNFRDAQGRLISCEHDSRRVTRTEHDGSITVLIDRFDGKPLNGPNDLCTHPDGSIWFTDPGYGTLYQYEGHWAEHELPARVYRLDPTTGAATVAVDDMVMPNGICFTPDFAGLYVVETGASHHPGTPRVIYRYDVADNRARGQRVFVDMSPGNSDGLRVDIFGNVWAGAAGGEGINGVHCFSPEGELIGQIHLPERCANLCFGGAKKNRLFMAASQSLYAVYVETVGAQSP
ncbi:MAG: SMP-30/gluconolactonase/LRE family protein [Spirochaetaceae bacterium]|nr:SMP-30/gluconolactonase/LRE family protein [Spirochaetaceae bacterium]